MSGPLRRFRAPRSPEESKFRRRLSRQGYSLPPHRRPTSIWREWVNRPLRIEHEVDLATREIEACGLVLHKDRPKNWDLLVALGTILERTNSRGAVLDMGAARYSKLLPSLYAYGYRRLAGIDLVPTGLRNTGPIEYLTMDLTQTTFPTGAFDAIACLSVIEHGVSPESFARETSRLLRAGGVAVISTDFWCSPIDTKGKSAYGVPIHVLTPDEVGTWLEVNARFGLQPVSAVELRCIDRVVRWEPVALEYTFTNLVLVKSGDPIRSRLARSRYRRGASASSAAVTQDALDDG
jgi:SAM-dependent methyltransferase